MDNNEKQMNNENETNKENEMNKNDISRDDIIRSLRACRDGNCADCAYCKSNIGIDGYECIEDCDCDEECESCGDCDCGNSDENKCYDSCYDDLMMDAARELEKPGIYIPGIINMVENFDNQNKTIQFSVQTESTAPVENRKTDSAGYEVAPSKPMTDRMDYIFSFIKKRMEDGLHVHTKTVDELYDLVHYYNRHCFIDEGPIQF